MLLIGLRMRIMSCAIRYISHVSAPVWYRVWVYIRVRMLTGGRAHGTSRRATPFRADGPFLHTVHRNQAVNKEIG